MTPFDQFRAATHCPFAQDSTWTVSASPDQPVDAPEYLVRAREGLDRTRLDVRDAGADGYVLRLPGAAGASVDRLRATTLDVARHLAGPEVSYRELEDPAWWLPYGDDRYFLVAFGPCFPATHTRFTFAEPETFLVFQHLQAFARRYPHGIPDGVRRGIKRRFAAAGRDYDYDMGAVPCAGAASASC